MRGGQMALPVTGLLIAMLSIQGGASLAKSIFPIAGPVGTVTLRVLFAALLLAIVLAPWKIRLTRANWRPVLLYGAALGLMNIFFYKAISTVPLGIAVAVEFVGPLGVAIATSRKPLDFLWILLAVAGLGALTPWAPGSGDIDLAGLGFALAAGACWAAYIVFGQAAGRDHGHRAAALGMVVAALVVLPIGIAEAGSTLLDIRILPVAIAIALLSSAIPYTLEMMALPRIAAPTFGTLMSLEPAIAAIIGYLALGENLSPAHWLAIVAIMAASAGAAASSTPPSSMRDAP